MQGNKTHEQFLRNLEHKSDVPSPHQDLGPPPAGAPRTARQDVNPTEYPISRGGMQQESRDHNKHNDGGQSGHRPMEPSPAQEKH